MTAVAALPDALATRPRADEHNHLGRNTPAPGLHHTDHTQDAGDILEPPFVMYDTVVTGLADADAQAEFEAQELRLSSLDALLRGDPGSSEPHGNSTWGQTASGGRRSLLHGRRNPRQYSGCPKCTSVQCGVVGGRKICDGHCKQGKQLFKCRSQVQTRGVCNTTLDERPDPYTLQPDPIKPLDSVQVLAPAPYIGCANITGVPDGCPDPGTTGAFADGTPLSVLTSWCVQHVYSPECVWDTAFHPFGFCQCMYVYEGKVALAPCETTYVDWEGPSTGDGENPVIVSAEGNMTRTAFGVTEAPDFVLYDYADTFTEKDENITVKMDLYRSHPEFGVNITFEAPLPEPAPANATTRPRQPRAASRRRYRGRE